MSEAALFHYIGTQILRRIALRMPRSRRALAERQESNWRRLRKALENTLIFHDLRLKDVRAYAEFVRAVPVSNYSFFDKYVSLIEAGERNVLFGDTCNNIALTSGTGGYDSKRVPINTGMLKLFSRTQMLCASRLALLEGSDLDVFRSARLTFGQPSNLYRRNGLTYGYISGLMCTRMPRYLRRMTVPSDDVVNTVEWDQKIRRVVEEAVGREIRVCSGIPSYFIHILQNALHHTGARTAKDIWPHLRYFIYTGTSLDNYQHRLDGLVGHGLRYYGFYAATEAPIGIPFRRFSDSTQYYLFNPELLLSFSASDSDEPVGFDAVRCGIPYSINVSTPNGFVQYRVGDVIEFEELGGELVFRFIGRDGGGVNVAAEKVTHEELLRTFHALRVAITCKIVDFAVVPGVNSEGVPAYQWTLFMDEAERFDEAGAVSVLDRELRGINLDYDECRRRGVVGSPRIARMDARVLDRIFENNRSRGQFKFKNAFRSEAEFQSYIHCDRVRPA
jgi:hypothetical protein